MKKVWHCGLRLTAIGSVLVAVLTTAAAPSFAQAPTTPPTEEQKTTARLAYSQGSAAFARGEFAIAYEQFKEANDTIPSPHAQYWMAESLDKLGSGDKAIAAYELFLSNPNPARAGEEKVAAAKERLNALKAEATAVQQAPAAAPVPPPAQGDSMHHVEPDAAVDSAVEEPLELPPKVRKWEIGVFGGPLLVSAAHDLHDEAMPRRAFSVPSLLFGLRAAFLPIEAFGIEAEYGHAEGTIKRTDNRASFNTFRGHFVGQLPIPGVPLVPFALVGAGIFQGSSADQGSNADLLIHGGVGLKLKVSKAVRLRLEFREDILPRTGGGLSFSEEILAGVGVAL